MHTLTKAEFGRYRSDEFCLVQRLTFSLDFEPAQDLIPRRIRKNRPTSPKCFRIWRFRLSLKIHSKFDPPIEILPKKHLFFVFYNAFKKRSSLAFPGQWHKSLSWNIILWILLLHASAEFQRHFEYWIDNLILLLQSQEEPMKGSYFSLF